MSSRDLRKEHTYDVQETSRGQGTHSVVNKGELIRDEGQRGNSRFIIALVVHFKVFVCHSGGDEILLGDFEQRSDKMLFI